MLTRQRLHSERVQTLLVWRLRSKKKGAILGDWQPHLKIGHYKETMVTQGGV